MLFGFFIPVPVTPQTAGIVQDPPLKPRRLQLSEVISTKKTLHVQGSVALLAFDREGHVRVQDELRAATPMHMLALASELQGVVRKAATSPHAHCVLQSLIEKMPLGQLTFIVLELAGACVEIAKNRYGYHVLCQLIERRFTEDALDAGFSGHFDRLVQELMQKTLALSKDAVGHQVVGALLQHGDEIQRSQVALSLVGLLGRHARCRGGSHVIERALLCVAVEDRQQLSQELLSNPTEIVLLAQHRFGRFVAKALLQLPDEFGVQAQRIICAALGELKGTKYGVRFIAELERDNVLVHPADESPTSWQQLCSQRCLSWADESDDEV